MLVAKIAERVTTPIGKMILDDLPNIPTGTEADDVSFYHAFDKIIQVLLRTRPHQHGFGLFAREQAIEILRQRVMRKIGLPVPILFYEILVEDGQPLHIFLSGIPVSVDKGGCFEEIGRRFRCFLCGLLRGGALLYGRYLLCVYYGGDRE